eukprot:TRINITY_DN9205_c0_g1_i1.p2 TRINITY_DN9205_c0_g1~~TRINITY_DN9205_c0_g1_i1.p2  ORF type:complete len:264 (-),score=82.64 TRINITY_DN9205_c0_g1_i1:69-860(-)
MSMRGRVALITGSTQGIGLGVAEQLASAGCVVILTGSRAREQVDSTLSRIRDAYNVECEYVQANLLDRESVAQLIQAPINLFGRLDILVNNAGVQHVSPIEEFGEDNWDRVLNINLTSCFSLMSKAIPHMKAQDWGRIINISSVHGLVASKNKSAYVAAKHGLNGLTKVAALELAECTTNVTCNAVCPGWVLTPLVQKQIDAIAEREGISNDAATQQLLQEKEPTGRFTTPAHIGEMCVFLCSDAGKNVTGTLLPMDGGWTAR